MTCFIYKCMFVVLMVKIIRCQDYSCNQFYQSFQENNFAKIVIPMSANYNNHIKLHVEVECVNTDYSQEDWKGKLQFLGTIEDFQQNLPLVYKMTYATPYIVLPRITAISVNNINLCVEEPTKGVRKVSKVNLNLGIKFENFGSNNGNNPNLNGNKLVTTERPLPLSLFYTTPSSAANPYIQKTTNADFNRNQNSNRKTGQLLPNVCGKISKMSGIQLIANGEDAEVRDHPWIGAMFRKEKDKSNKPMFLCGASLITKKLALTAGHCMIRQLDTEIYITFGRALVNDWLDDNSQLVKVAKSEIHPEYRDFTADADIAIIRFTKEITFTATVQPVCLWDTDSLSENIINQTGVIVGWGKNEKYEFPEHLQKLFLRAVDEEECLRTDGQYFNITSSRTICAGNNDYSGPCLGDSGSGFYFYMNDRWFIRGIVSQSLSDSSMRCDFSKYSVYLDVAKHMQWIRQFL